MEKYILGDKVYILVNPNSCHARVLDLAIGENMHSVELAHLLILINISIDSFVRLLIQIWLLLGT